MTVVVLVLVVVGWLVYLGSWLWNRRVELPVDSVHSFHQQLSVLSALDRTSRRAGSFRPLAPVPEPFRLTRSQARRRRREVFFFLVAAATLTLALAVVLGGAAMYAHLLVDITLLAYITLLIRMQKLAAEREAKVRYLPRPNPQPRYEPSLAWQRSAAR